MAKTLKAKKDKKNKDIAIKPDKENKSKKDFIAKLGKQICGDNFQLPTVL